MKYFYILSLIGIFSCKKDSNTALTSNLKAELEYKIESQLGEGAFWNHQTQELYWVDIEGMQLHIYNPSNKTNRSLSTPSRIGTVVPYNQNQAVVALEDGIYRINTQTGALRLLSDVESDMPENRFNDGKCDPMGNLWVGSMHFEQTEPNASLYRINTRGFTSKMKDSVTISNGIVWTSDAKTMFYIDTPSSQIKAFDFDVTTATISNERVAVEISPKDGYPDGMAIDENNMLWVGLWNGNAVGQYDPYSGKLVSKIEVPAHNVTSCAFGGENLDILYITTARIDMTRDELVQNPLSGSIFRVNPGVKGVKSSFFGQNMQ